MILALVYLSTCLLVPLLAVLLLASRTPKFNPRYLMLVSPAYLLILAGGIGALVGGASAREQRRRGAEGNAPRSTYHASRITSALLLSRFATTQPRVEIAETPEQAPSADREVLEKILAEVRARTNLDFSKYKHPTVVRRIRRRMQLHQKEFLADYLEFVRSNPKEATLLADEFLITVTQFFRDAEVFSYLEREIIPQLFAGKTASDHIRVWSVGCATGEEAYSIAMLLLERAGRLSERPNIEIFASDLHEPSLRMARDGRFPDTIEGDVSAERLKRFFTKEENSYRIRQELREIVVFASHNLLRDPPFSRLDLIICRNLLIYLQRELQNDVIEVFHYALKPGGLLLLGPSEFDRPRGALSGGKQAALLIPAP